MDACKERYIDFSGQLNVPWLTDNESHYSSMTPEVSSVYSVNDATAPKMFISLARRNFELVIT
jgi:hypothetical protein